MVLVLVLAYFMRGRREMMRPLSFGLLVEVWGLVVLLLEFLLSVFFFGGVVEKDDEDSDDCDCCSETVTFSSVSVVSAGAAMTTHMKPTNRPDEHSLRNAIISQNCSKFLTLRQ